MDLIVFVIYQHSFEILIIRRDKFPNGNMRVAPKSIFFPLLQNIFRRNNCDKMSQSRREAVLQQHHQHLDHFHQHPHHAHPYHDHDQLEHDQYHHPQPQQQQPRHRQQSRSATGANDTDSINLEHLKSCSGLLEFAQLVIYNKKKKILLKICTRIR